MSPRTKKHMPGGRPNVVDETVLQKLEEAFLNGATDRQACFLANIAEGTLYNYIKEHPEFGERKELLKQQTAYLAKVVVNNAIKDKADKDTARWYLERKDKEFKQKSDITTNDKDIPSPIIQLDALQRSTTKQQKQEGEDSVE